MHLKGLSMIMWIEAATAHKHVKCMWKAFQWFCELLTWTLTDKWRSAAANDTIANVQNTESAPEIVKSQNVQQYGEIQGRYKVWKEPIDHAKEHETQIIFVKGR